MTSWTLFALAAGLAVSLAATSARAEHNTALAPERDPAVATPGADSTLDITLKLGLNGFRLGSRVFGRDGYAGGAWLNGETRPDGFSVDGRVERDGKAHNFKFNAEIDGWLRRALRWGGMDL